MHSLMANSFFQFSVQFGIETHSSIVLVKTSNQLSQNKIGMYRRVGICFLQIVSKSGCSVGLMFDAPRLPSVLFELVSVLPVNAGCYITRNLLYLTVRI